MLKVIKACHHYFLIILLGGYNLNETTKEKRIKNNLYITYEKENLKKWERLDFF